MLKLVKVLLAGALCAGAAVAPAACAQPSDGGHPWRTYVNVRYRYAVCYPADLLKPEPEAPDSDGRTFDGRDGAELAVFGRNNVGGQSLAAAVAQDAADMAGRGGQVTYRAGKGDWAVYSGRTSGTLFYSKTLKRGDQFLIFQLKYPQAQAAVYGPVAARLSRCFALTH